MKLQTVCLNTGCIYSVEKVPRKSCNFLLFNQFNPTDMFEDVFDMAILYSISPELTCNCDEFHICQQCHEEK